MSPLQSAWFEEANLDMLNAKLLFNANGTASRIGLLLQQAIEKSLKGWLIARGWELVKTHDLELLLDQAAQRDSRFREFIPYGRIVSRFYVTDRYPPIRRLDISVEEMKALIEKGDRLMNMLKSDTND
ncbi:MAG: HEPN domain-containing protein [Calditrichaeota bacterium]|nr:HEPN domain-containing protein [Calditrichota bacterium]